MREAVTYTPEQREEAALICAVAACELTNTPYYIIAWHLDASDDALHLAADARTFAMYSYSWQCEVGAEAEALLRTGWSP